jgi:NitT/TauT family transport system substrate-binding protein
MTIMRLAGIVRVAALLCVLAAHPVSAQGVEQPQVALMVDWVIQGTHAPFFVAETKGYFKDEGLTVRIDPGKGGGNVVSAIASGTYQVGYADIPTIVQFNAQNPDKMVIAVYCSFDETPLALVSLKKTGIVKPMDLDGKRIAAPAGSAMTYSLPVMLKAAHAESVKINWLYVAPQLMGPMLVRGEADMTGGFTNSQIPALLDLGVKMEDVAVLRFADIVDMYGLALFVTKKFADENPRTVAGLVRALNKGTKDTIADPAAGIAVLKQKDALMNTDVELVRLQIALGHTITKHVRENGLSSVTTKRLQGTIDTVNAGQPLPRAITPADIWTDKFLPPAAERRLAAVNN